MSLRPSPPRGSHPLLPSPHHSLLTSFPPPFSNFLRAAHPTVSQYLMGEYALGCNVLEDMQFELAFLAVAAPHLCAMLLATEGDLDALDIPSGSRLLLVLPPVAPDSSVALLPGSPLTATPSWHALSSSCLWSSQVPASLAALACPALPSLRQGAVARRSSLLVSPDDCSPADSPHGRRFGQNLPVLRLHSDRGGEFSSNLLRDFCRGEGILQSFTLLDSPQQNGIAERRIGLVMEVARSSMIHAAAPHFLWSFAVQYAAHQLNLWPRVSLPELDGEGWRCISVPDAPGWQFYHPTLRRVLPSQDVMFDKSGPDPSGVSQVDPPLGAVPGEVAMDSGAARDTVYGGAEPGGAELRGAEPRGAETGGAASEGAESGGAEPQGAALFGSSDSASPRLSSQQLCEWLVRRARFWSGATRAGGAGAEGAGVATGAAGTGGVGGAGAGESTESGAAGGSGAGGAGARGVGGAGVLGTPSSTGLTPPLLCPPPDQSQPSLEPAFPLPAPSPYTEHSGGLTVRREPVSQPVSPNRTACRVPHSRPPLIPGTHAMTLRPSSVPLQVPLPAPPESSLPEVPNPESDRALAAGPTVSRLLTTAITDPSFESTIASTLVAELLVAACRLNYATPLVAESTSASPPSVGGECALGTDVLEGRQEDFECLAAAVPRFASMLLAPEGDPDAPDIPTPRSYAEAITGPCSSQWQAAMNAETASWKSTGTYVDEVPPHGANIVDGMWIFWVKRPLGSPPASKARYVARGFSQRQGVDYFQTFSPTPKMTTLQVLLHIAAQRDYELHSLDFGTAFL
ncbi:unnamed protein product [Closterium sp. NIES-54]